MLLRRDLRRRLVRVSEGTEVLRRALRRVLGRVLRRVLRRQKHALSQSTTPSACTLWISNESESLLADSLLTMFATFRALSPRGWKNPKAQVGTVMGLQPTARRVWMTVAGKWRLSLSLAALPSILSDIPCWAYCQRCSWGRSEVIQEPFALQTPLPPRGPFGAETPRNWGRVTPRKVWKQSDNSASDFFVLLSRTGGAGPQGVLNFGPWSSNSPCSRPGILPNKSLGQKLRKYGRAILYLESRGS